MWSAFVAMPVSVWPGVSWRGQGRGRSRGVVVAEDCGGDEVVEVVIGVNAWRRSVVAFASVPVGVVGVDGRGRGGRGGGGGGGSCGWW